MGHVGAAIVHQPQGGHDSDYNVVDNPDTFIPVAADDFAERQGGDLPMEWPYFRYTKASSGTYLATCKKYNLTACTHAACQRAHGCMRCGQMGHGIQDCGTVAPRQPYRVESVGPRALRRRQQAVGAKAHQKTAPARKPQGGRRWG